MVAIFFAGNKQIHHPSLQDTYWSYLLQRSENEGLLGIAGVAFLFRCPVRSYQYDGAMIDSPSPAALARAGLSANPERFLQILTKVTGIVASFMVGCDMPVKIKELALPDVWQTISDLETERATDKKLLQAKVFFFFLLCICFA